MSTDFQTCYELLPRVSRTFALNIRILPGELRPSITVAYLLFRLVDTIEDAPGLCAEDRSALFDAFLDRLDGTVPLELPGEPRVHLLETTTPDERALLDAGETVFAAFESLPVEIREIVSAHVAETARGMQRISGDRRQDGLLQLETWKDLDEYCYYVAGTIGIMLTRLFAVHTHHLDRRSERHLMALGTNFGRGLQLTNILKGIVPDR
ncbi:MAG TPA: squalene/phytoene synthase family protein, partial [bacterium]|nr:squalene/phytoene synthase family protein [bacterium]